MWNWFTFFLIVHILAVLVAFGPSFGYPIIGALIAKHPQHAVFGTEVIETIATRMTIPLAVVVPLSGTGLIYNVHIDLWHSEWLVISIVLYTAMFIYGVFVQTRTGAKLLHVLQSMPPGPPSEGGPPPEVAALSRKLRLGGMYLTLSVVVIMVLMIWRPGGAITH